MAGGELGVRGELDGGLVREPEPVGGAERRMDELRRWGRLRVEQQHGLRAGQPDVRDPQHGRCRWCRLERDAAVHAPERIDADRRLSRREHVCGRRRLQRLGHGGRLHARTTPTTARMSSSNARPACRHARTAPTTSLGCSGFPAAVAGRPLPQRRMRRRVGLRLQLGRQRRRVVAGAAVVGEPPALQRSDTERQRRRAGRC